jgi:DNA-binding NarL/FixJ family response regulator
MKRWRLLLADDHDIVIEGLRRILDRPEFEIVGVVNDGLSLLRAAEAFQPDIIIADITMPFRNRFTEATPR